APAPPAPAAAAGPAAAPPPEAGEVVFSSPTDGETQVSPGSPVRVQFSRGLDPASLADRIRVAYAGVGQTPGPPEPLAFTFSYDAATRAIEIRLTRPPESFRTVQVEILEGIRTFDGAPVQPWTFTFAVGG
ncbi:MAG: Ig-like domain-containing protein, partial [Acidobacteria bacterium]|nr:Ig-like domain-containing protein [Acidobacteriota bacterium]